MPDPVRRSPLTPSFSYDERARQYRSAAGRFVSRQQVKGALEGVVTASQGRIDGLTQSLRDGQINIATWQSAMASEVKAIHTASAAAAKGGWAQMSQADWGRVGQQVRGQYAYLNNFAAQVASGQQRLDGTLNVRAGLYGKAGRETFEVTKRQVERAGGMTEQRNILGRADHCAECLSETARGWIPITEYMSPPGRRLCLGNCKCWIEYRQAEE